MPGFEPEHSLGWCQCRETLCRVPLATPLRFDKLEGFAGDEVYTVHGKGKGQRFSPSQKFTPSLLSTWYGLAPLALILTCCD